MLCRRSLLVGILNNAQTVCFCSGWHAAKYFQHTAACRMSNKIGMCATPVERLKLQRAGLCIAGTALGHVVPCALVRYLRERLLLTLQSRAAHLHPLSWVDQPAAQSLRGVDAHLKWLQVLAALSCMHLLRCVQS